MLNNDGELTNKQNFLKKDLDFKSNFEYDLIKHGI